MRTVLIWLVTAIIGTAGRQKILNRNLIRYPNDKRTDSYDLSSSSSEESGLTECNTDKSLTFEEYLRSAEDNFEPAPPLPLSSTEEQWLEWEETNDLYIPMNAVYGGYEGNNTFFVMRAAHIDEFGNYVGRFLGKFSPISKFASISYHGKEYRKSNFELYLHKRHAWAARGDPRALIPGGNTEYFCRFESDFQEHWTPGRLDAQQTVCRIPHDGDEVSSTGYETLRTACSGRRAAPNEAKEPGIAPYEDVVAHPEKYRGDLTDNGVWVVWNNRKIGVPSNAIYGGFTTLGPVFMIIADHATPTGMKRIPGVYYPSIRRAYVDFDNQPHEKTVFDVLIHNSYRWRTYQEDDVLIDVFGQNYCSGFWDDGQIRVPGRYDPSIGYCFLILHGQVLSFNANFRFLARSC